MDRGFESAKLAMLEGAIVAAKPPYIIVPFNLKKVSGEISPDPELQKLDIFGPDGYYLVGEVPPEAIIASYIKHERELKKPEPQDIKENKMRIRIIEARRSSAQRKRSRQRDRIDNQKKRIAKLKQAHSEVFGEVPDGTIKKDLNPEQLEIYMQDVAKDKADIIMRDVEAIGGDGIESLKIPDKAKEGLKMVAALIGLKPDEVNLGKVPDIINTAQDNIENVAAAVAVSAPVLVQAFDFALNMLTGILEEETQEE